MYGSADRLPVKNGDAAVEGDELGPCPLEGSDQRLLTPLSMMKLGLEKLDVVPEAPAVVVAHGLPRWAFVGFVGT